MKTYTVATGSPAQAAYLLTLGFPIKDARLHKGVVVFKFDGAAHTALEKYRRAHNEVRARLERARQETLPHASAVH